MFGFGKSKVYDDNFDYEAVVSRYEGEMVVGDYVAESLNRAEVNKLGNEYHVMIPDGKGKITYLYHGEIIEEYEGDFDGGKYHGKGRLVWRGEVYEGLFQDGEFVG
jgi:hypothetical protein